MPTPRLPLNGASGLKAQSVLPVAGSSAKICPAASDEHPSALTRIGAFDTWRSGNSIDHAPPSVLMFDVLICASVE